MAARKLQTEIERTLKRVDEGVDLFESIYEKMQASTNQTQKEKLEADLKTQIKKLQRMRDQIKSWVQSSDIKDKSQLTEHRRTIETQMEKFKACEKEMKTKAFSKEGLIAALRLDPKEKEKLETTSWISNQVDELSRQIEQAEAEIETLQGGVKKKGKNGSTHGRLEELEAQNDRRKWHIGRLEIILRMIENGTLPVEDVLPLKDDISYFVDNNADEEFNYDEGIYDDLNLDDFVADDVASEHESDDGTEDFPPRISTKDTLRGKSNADDESEGGSRKDQSPVMKKQSVPLRKPSLLDPPKLAASVAPTANFAAQPMSQALKSGLPSSGAPGTAGSKPALPPIRYSAAVTSSGSAGTSASLAALNTTTPNPTSATSPPSTTPAAPATASSHITSPSIPTARSQDLQPSSPSTGSPSARSASANSRSEETPPPTSALDTSLHESPPQSPTTGSAETSASGSPAHSRSNAPESVTESPYITQSQAAEPLSATNRALGQSAAPPALQRPLSIPPPLSQPSSLAPQPQQPLALPSPLPQQVQAQQFVQTSEMPMSAGGTSPLSSVARQVQTQPNEQGQRPQNSNQQATSSAPQLPSSLGDLVASFESAKQKAPHRMSNLDQVHRILENGFATVPQPLDTEKPKYYVPSNPYITPSFYPQTPLPLLNSPSLFSQLDLETLFYVFYYHCGTYQQYLAANELKKQSWRFHVKFLTWFQRHSEPQAITDEYEQGVYVYFDWEGSWCQRKKSDFRFEYRYLSED